MHGYDCNASKVDVGLVEQLMEVGRCEARKLGMRVPDAEECACELRQHMLSKHPEMFASDALPPALAWLRTCARNYAINYCRGQHRCQRDCLPVAELEHNDIHVRGRGAATDPQDIILQQERRQHVRHALTYLTIAQLHTILAYYYESREVEEIAAELGCTVNAVHHHLSRARSTLRRVLKADEHVHYPIRVHRNAP